MRATGISTITEKSAILGFMEQHGIVLTELDAFVSRGGHTEPVHSGVYRITPKMLEQSRSMKYGKPRFRSRRPAGV